jgi:hypothetical protein
MLEKLRSPHHLDVALGHLLDDPETYRRTCGDGNGEKRLRPAKNAYGVRTAHEKHPWKSFWLRNF